MQMLSDESFGGSLL